MTVDPRTPPARPRIRVDHPILRVVHVIGTIDVGDVPAAAVPLIAARAVTRRRRRRRHTPVVLLHPTAVHWPEENDRDPRLARFPLRCRIRDPAVVRHQRRRRRLVLRRVLVHPERRNEFVIHRIGRAVAHPLLLVIKVPVPMRKIGTNDDAVVVMLVGEEEEEAETTPKKEENPSTIRHRTKHRVRPSQK